MTKATEPPLDSNGNNGEQGLDVGERGLGSDSGKSVGGGIKVTEVLVERSGIEIEETHAVVDGESSGLVNGVDLPVTLSQYRIVEGKKEMVTREGVTDKGNAKSPVREKSSYAEAVNVGTGTTAGPDFEIVDGVADIEIPTEIFEDVEPLWKSFAVGYFMGDSPFIGSIHSTVNRIWSSPKSKIDVQFISKRTVLFRIEDEQMRKRVLRRKYWHIGDVPLVVCEWNPETAQNPPDLSAMPLWVDLVNVPGYLYSLEGLRFLSRTAGNFVKLHPNTEKCVRMDVARVLVEVNLMKPLPQKISFKDKDQCSVTVEVFYPWLPPRCMSCEGWGHTEKECTKAQTKTILKRDQSLEKKSEATGSDKEVVLKLLSDLEQIDAIVVDVNNTVERIEEGPMNGGGEVLQTRIDGEWTQNGKPSSPRENLQSQGECRVVSPNGFQVLSGIREEGEIDEEEEENGTMRNDGFHLQEVGGNKEERGDASESQERELQTSHVSNQKGRGKGSRMQLVSNKSFIQAVKSTNNKKGSSKRK